MKAIGLFWFWLAIPLQGLSSGLPPVVKLANARVELFGGRQVNGYLYAINDSSLEISPNSFVRSLNRSGQNTKIIYIRDIKNLKLRKIESVKAGAVLVGICGAIIGGILGNSLYTPCDRTVGWLGLSRCNFEVVDRTAASLIGVVLGTISGTGIGILIGSQHKIFRISGSQKAFEKQKNDLITYLPKLS